MRAGLLVLTVLAGLLIAAPVTGGTACASPPPQCDRILDDDEPIGAAISQAQRDFVAGGVPYVILGRHDAFPDNLAAAALTGPASPLLYTLGGPSQPLPREVFDEIVRLLGSPAGGACDVATAEVFIVGGPNAVSQLTQDTLTGSGYCVQRFGGASRFETAELIASEVRRRSGSTEVIVARADDWADAATAGAWAAETGTPIVITSTATLHPAAEQVLRQPGITRVIIVGGPAAVSQTVEDQIRNVLRLSVQRVFGSARDLTAVAIYEQLWGADPHATGFQIINGYVEIGWAYAFAAAPNSAQRDYPQLLTATDGLTQPTIDVLLAARPQVIQGAGPPAVVPDQVINDAGSAAQGTPPGQPDPPDQPDPTDQPDPPAPTLDLQVIDEVTLAGVTDVCGLAFDEVVDRFAVVQCDSNQIQVLAGDGGAAATYPLPVGGTTNSVDLDFLRQTTAFAGEAPDGLLFGIVNGASPNAFLLNIANGEVFSTVDVTQTDRVVGGSIDPSTGDILTLSANQSIRRVDGNGAVIAEFPTIPDGTDASFQIFFGDIEVACNGSLWLVSSSESPLLGLAGDGSFRGLHDVTGLQPADAENTAAIAFDNATGQAWLGLNDSGRILLVDGFDGGTCPGVGAPPTDPSPSGEPIPDTTIATEVTLEGHSRSCGLGYDGATDTFYVVACNIAEIHRFSGSGASAGDAFPLPGGASSSVDVEVVTESATINGVSVAPGSLLVANGARGNIGLWVVSATDGSILTGPVALTGTPVGVSYDAIADEIVVLDTAGDIVRRYTAATMMQTAEFPTIADDAPDGVAFGVNFGDLDVGCDGNLYIVGSSSRPILETGPTGDFVALHEITNQTAETEQNKSSIDFDQASQRLWVGLNDAPLVQGMDGLDPGAC